MDLERHLKALISQHAKWEFPLENVSTDSDLLNDFGYDSLAMIELIVAIEEDFEIVVDDDQLDVEALTNYGTLLDLVLNRTSPHPSMIEDS